MTNLNSNYEQTDKEEDICLSHSEDIYKWGNVQVIVNQSQFDCELIMLTENGKSVWEFLRCDQLMCDNFCKP